MRVLHAQQVEVLLPIRTFFRQRRRTETNFDPGYRTITTKPSVLHVFEIFIASDGALAQDPSINGLHESQFLSRLHPCFNEVAHNTADDTPKVPSVLRSRIVGLRWRELLADPGPGTGWLVEQPHDHQYPAKEVVETQSLKVGGSGKLITYNVTATCCYRSSGRNSVTSCEETDKPIQGRNS